MPRPPVCGHELSSVVTFVGTAQSKIWPFAASLKESKLRIQRLVDGARKVQQRASAFVPLDTAVVELASEVVEAIDLAARRVARMRSPLSLPKIRVYLIISAVATLVWWAYANYLQPKVVKVAATAEDFAVLSDRVRVNNIPNIEFVISPGSPDNVILVENKATDVAVVQGGVQLPAGLTVVGSVLKEHILYFVRDNGQEITVPRVVTYKEGQGSHLLGQLFFRLWGYETVSWIHSWDQIGSNAAHVIASDATAIFIVVDPANPIAGNAIKRVTNAGFHLRDLDIGVHATHLPYLNRIDVPPGYYRLKDPTIPDDRTRNLRTYTVNKYMVTSPSLTYAQKTTLRRAFELSSAVEALPSTFLHTQGISLTADLDHALSVIVNFVIIIVALFGLEILFYRHYIHELNSLISRISLLQSERDLHDINDREKQKPNIFALETCSDLLGLISSLAGLYGQENAALMFQGLTGSVHNRANTLKINIQLKILQGGPASITLRASD